MSILHKSCLSRLPNIIILPKTHYLRAYFGWSYPQRDAAMPAHPGPLLTRFTPPSGCFEHVTATPAWQTCGEATDVASQSVSCIFFLPASCYPSGASIWPTPASAASFSYGGTVSGKQYIYSPGALPSGFTCVFSAVTLGITTQVGCLLYVIWRTKK